MDSDADIVPRSIIVIGGLGHIGLPLSALLSKNGRRTAVYDTNEHAKKAFIHNDEPTFYEPGLQELLIDNEIEIEDHLSAISKYEFIIISIGTPVDEYLNPKIDVIINLIKDMLPYLGDQHTIILRSTVYPGTTKKIEKLLMINKIKAGIAFCPERVMGGKMIEELQQLPQIISANYSWVMPGIVSLFKTFNKVDPKFLYDTTEGELAKLFTNSHRYLSFAISNQFFMIAQKMNVDFYEIYHAMTDGYERLNGFAIPGFTGGYCLRKDTLQLLGWDNSFHMGLSASMVNEGIPLFIFRELRKKFQDLSGLTIGILGMAFKPGVDDDRDSLSFRLKKIFENECKTVLCTDPYVKRDYFVDVHFLIEKSDVIILACPHKQYEILRIEKPVVDIMNFYGKGIGL
jgi:UDP-N-acetyl-D-mannosaminuronic acid dehydrogenase